MKKEALSVKEGDFVVIPSKYGPCFAKVHDGVAYAAQRTGDVWGCVWNWSTHATQIVDPMLVPNEEKAQIEQNMIDFPHQATCKRFIRQCRREQAVSGIDARRAEYTD